MEDREPGGNRILKLLYFVQYFPPETAAGLTLVKDMIEVFAKRGMDVVVYTPVPTRGVDDKTREYWKKHKVTKVNDHLVIKRMSLYREGTAFKQRAIRYFIFSFECIIKGIFVPADLYFLSSGPPSQTLVVGVLRHLTKKRITYNLQDMFPDSLINAGMTKEDSKLVKIGRWMERVSYKNAHAIITVSDDMLKNVLGKGVDKAKLFMVRNWIDTDEFVPVPREKNVLFDTLRLEREKFYLVYSGNIGYTMGLEFVVQAMERVGEDIEFLIFGEGSDKEKLQKYVAEKGIKNVRFLPFQDAKLISNVYSIGDMAVISGRKGLSGVSMPSKTWTIMATGTGILAQFDKGSELDRTIKEAGCGVTVEPGNVEQIAEMIRELAKNKEKCSGYGENARKYAVDNISKEKAIDEYFRIIKG